MGPSEDPESKKDRLRERRLSLLDNRDAAETTAGDLTTDLDAVYGLKGLSMFGARGRSKAKAKTAAPVRNVQQGEAPDNYGRNSSTSGRSVGGGGK